MIRRHTRLRIAWDGPHPHAGDFLAGRHPGLIWRIQTVTPDRAPGGELTLALQRHDGVVPRRAILHPPERGHRTDLAGPARVRQLITTGPNAVMRANWRDPDDIRPNAARRPAQITGYRTYCPLRRMAAGSGSQITDTHIIAADQFRAQVDLAVIGRGGSSLGELARYGFGPLKGPSPAAIVQACADKDVRQVLRHFAPSHCLMLTHILLLNQSLRSWCLRLTAERGKPVQEHVEMGRLLTILDLLVHHYDLDIALAQSEMID